MPTIKEYERAIAKANADNNPEAVSELQAMLAEEHPPTANAGDRRKARRKQDREERTEEQIVIPDASITELTSAIERAEEDGNDEAVQELKIYRGIKRAEQDDNQDAVAELKGMLGAEVFEPTQTRTRKAVQEAQESKRADQQTIAELEQLNPETMTTAQQAELRAAYEREQERSEEAARQFDRIQRGEALSDADRARAYGTILAEAASFGIVGDEVTGSLRALFDENLTVSESIDEMRRVEKQFREENPVASVSTDLLAGAGASGAVYKGLGRFADSPWILNRTAKAGAQGAGEMGIIGFMEGEDSLGDRLDKAGDYARTGALFGGTLSLGADAAIAGGRAVANRAGRGNDLPNPRAERTARLRNEKEVADIQRSQSAADDEQLAFEQGQDSERLLELAEAETAARLRQARRKGGSLNRTDYEQTAEYRDWQSTTAEELAEKYGLENANAALGRVTKMNAAELDEFLEVPMLRDVNPSTAGKVEKFDDKKMKSKVANFLTPSMRSARERVGEGFAETLNNGLNLAMRTKELMGTNVIQPMVKKGYYEAIENDKEIKRLLLNAYNTSLSATKRGNYLKAAQTKLAKATGRDVDDVRMDFTAYYEGRGRYAVRPYADVDKTTPLTNDMMHTARIKEREVVEGAMKTEDEAIASRVGSNMAVKPQTRPEFKAGDKEIDEYLNPLDSDNRWMSERITDNALAEQFAIRGATSKADRKAIEQGTYIREGIRERMTELGYTEKQVANAGALVESTTKTALQKMNPVLSTIRSFSFLGTIANPKSALLNPADYFSAGAEVGYMNIIKTFFEDANIKVDARDMGLAQVVTGDLLKGAKRELKGFKGTSADAVDKGMQNILDKAMKASGFEDSTLATQERIMKAAVLKARGQVKTQKGTVQLREEASEFMDKDEVNTLVDVMRKAKNKAGVQKVVDGEAVSSLSGKEQRVVTMYMLSALSKAQPINPLGRSLFNISNPNGRIITLLTTWSIRNADLMRTKIVDNWKKGNKKAAIHGIIALNLSGLGFAAVNQARQELFGAQLGDAVAATGIPQEMGYRRKEQDDKWRKADMDQFVDDYIYTILTMPFGGYLPNNEVGLSKLKNDPVGQAGEMFIPPVPIAEQAVKDIRAALDGEKDVEWRTLDRAPVIAPFVKGIRETFEEDL